MLPHLGRLAAGASKKSPVPNFTKPSTLAASQPRYHSGMRREGFAQHFERRANFSSRNNAESSIRIQEGEPVPIHRTFAQSFAPLVKPARFGSLVPCAARYTRQSRRIVTAESRTPPVHAWLLAAGAASGESVDRKRAHPATRFPVDSSLIRHRPNATARYRPRRTRC